MQIAILGRQPKISLAELEALYSAEKITPIADYAALVDSSKPLPQSRLGGTLKSATLLTELAETDLTGAFDYLQSSILDIQSGIPKGKLQFGVSVYGFKAQKYRLLQQLLQLKKIVKKSGRSIRIIENKSESLEAAQVLYNKLTGELGIEILIIKNGSAVIIAKTTGVQNIDDYSKRDFDRPKRDAFVGMLPPKLAQIMLNLAVQQSQESRVKSQENEHNSALIPHDSNNIVVLDPFCGTGVVLQEALLMGYYAYGTDVSEKMVDYSEENLAWLTRSVIPDSDRGSSQKYSDKVTQNELDPVDKPEVDKRPWKVEQADATNHKWNFSRYQDLRTKVYIVCETYLGEPLSNLPSEVKLQKIITESDKIAEDFLKNIAPQLKKGTRLCVALPAWIKTDSVERGARSNYTPNTKHQTLFHHLKTLDHLKNLGYNRLDFVHATRSELIYHRSDQIVARELTILVKS